MNKVNLKENVVSFIYLVKKKKKYRWNSNIYFWIKLNCYRLEEAESREETRYVAQDRDNLVLDGYYVKGYNLRQRNSPRDAGYYCK